jgi:tRNA threonylcarbamoyladenosine biosynthesis protein TsaE
MRAGALYTLADTEALGARIAALLRPGDAVLLEGPLGAGKTTLVRALIRAACVAPTLEVPSPSYTLVQSYEARGFVLHHFDLWRLDGPQALPDLGWDEALADVVLVEWPDRLQGMRPADALHHAGRLGGPAGLADAGRSRMIEARYGATHSRSG